jgi:3,4-dihydroxy 2-butanone 4-phosphate synthase/GTP cyclohydrolase II
MRLIGQEGRGVIVLIREPLATSLSDAVRSRAGIVEPPRPAATERGAATSELRDYGVGAQILLDLGVRNMVLLSNRHKTIVGLEGYGLKVEGERPIPLDIS